MKSVSSKINSNILMISRKIKSIICLIFVFFLSFKKNAIPHEIATFFAMHQHDDLAILDFESRQYSCKALEKILSNLGIRKVNTISFLDINKVENLIQELINSEKAEKAIDILNRIEHHQEPFHFLSYESSGTTNVQLMFLYARALDSIGKTEKALNIYLEMTEKFPEFPEPWNNLAILYDRMGMLSQAKRSLEMSKIADPNSSCSDQDLSSNYK